MTVLGDLLVTLLQVVGGILSIAVAWVLTRLLVRDLPEVIRETRERQRRNGR